MPNRQQDPGRARPEDCQIIGGYASHEWATSQELLEGASNGKDDDGCFLFNLTQNLRFNAVSNRGPYQMVDKVSDSRRILFGREALCIENDFRRLTSRIGSIQDPNTQFSFGDDLMQKSSKVNSIIPGENEIGTPTLVEVWTFALRS